MDLGIRGRKALLCGASRGLGKAAALAVAKEGVDVTIMARTPDVLERTAKEIRDATGVRVTMVAGDITTEAGRAAALKACPEPDILLNNADGPLPGDFRTWTRDTWIEALDAMMLGADRDDPRHRRRHDGARLWPHHQHLVAQREDPAT